jgi:hypothetical protein
LPVALADFKNAVRMAEQRAVEKATEKLAALRAEFASYTRNWVKANDQMQVVLKEDMERLDREIRSWEPRTVPLGKRLAALESAESERDDERKRLINEWPTIENREKGESLRRIFHEVRLFWDKSFRPASERPTRPRKTSRTGRHSFRLQKDRIVWAFNKSHLDASW